jgi:hypothetical protein
MHGAGNLIDVALGADGFALTSGTAMVWAVDAARPWQLGVAPGETAEADQLAFEH